MTTLIDVEKIKALTAEQRKQLRQDLEQADKEAHAGDVEKAKEEIDAVLKKYNVTLSETHPVKTKVATDDKPPRKPQKNKYVNPDNPKEVAKSTRINIIKWLTREMDNGQHPDKFLVDGETHDQKVLDYFNARKGGKKASSKA